MHIALVISSLQAGGSERVISNLANAWVARGHQVTILTLSAPQEVPMYPLDRQIHLIQLNQSLLTKQNLIWRFLKILVRIYKIRQQVKALEPHIVISFVDIMNVTTIIATRFLGIPVLVAERSHPKYYHIPHFYAFLRHLTYPWADKVIAQTSSAMESFSDLSDDKKVIIPNIVHKPYQQKSEDEILKPVKHIVSLGRLIPSKRFDILIRAFAKIVSLYPDLKLTIYGEGPERKDLEALITKMGLSDQVILPGIISDVERALQKSDMFVFPTLFEGFPNALCEAMVVGLPVIASNTSGTVDIVREGRDGRLFPIGDGEALTKLMLELIQDPVQRLRLSREALSLADRFSEPSILQKWDDLFRELNHR